MSGSTGSWRRRHALAVSVQVIGNSCAAVLALCGAFVLSRVLDHPGRFGEIAWWVAVAAVAGLIFLGIQPLARRLLVLSGLLMVSLEFPARAPSRVAVAWRFSDPVDVQRRLDDANRREWTPANQTNRALLAATLGVLEQRRRQSVVVFRVGDKEVSAKVVESDIPGFLQLAKMGTDSRRRRLLTVAAGTGAAALLATAALARGPSGPGDLPSATPGASTPPTLGLRPTFPQPSAAPTARSDDGRALGAEPGAAPSGAPTGIDAGSARAGEPRRNDPAAPDTGPTTGLAASASPNGSLARSSLSPSAGPVLAASEGGATPIATSSITTSSITTSSTPIATSSIAAPAAPTLATAISVEPASVSATPSGAGGSDPSTSAMTPISHVQAALQPQLGLAAAAAGEPAVAEAEASEGPPPQVWTSREGESDTVAIPDVDHPVPVDLPYRSGGSPDTKGERPAGSDDGDPTDGG
jgi:hypothetical protein